MRRDPRYLNVNEHTKICGEQFVIEDYLNPYSVKKRLKDGAVPSIFAWNKDKNQYKKRRSVTEKLEANYELRRMKQRTLHLREKATLSQTVLKKTWV